MVLETKLIYPRVGQGREVSGRRVKNVPVDVNLAHIHPPALPKVLVGFCACDG